MQNTKVCPYCKTTLPLKKTFCSNPTCGRLVFSSDPKTNLLFTFGALGVVILIAFQGFVILFKLQAGGYQAEGLRKSQQEQQVEAQRQQRIQQATELLKEGREATERAFPELKNP